MLDHSGDATPLGTPRPQARPRSAWAVAAAATILASVPLAVASQTLGESAAQVVVHLVLGIGMLLFVRAVFDFGLATWINAIGAVSAALFGVVFLLQAVSSLVPANAWLHDLAFGLLGNWPELVLVLGVDVWFLGLLMSAHGRTRLIGWAIVPLGTAYHVISLAGVALAISVPPLGVITLLLPFVWLIVEGAQRSAPRSLGPRSRDTDQLEVTTV